MNKKTRIFKTYILSLYICVTLLQIGDLHAQAQQSQSNNEYGTLIMSKEDLSDKIKGGWAGQTIGVTFGGAYEFQFQGTFIGDYQGLFWNDTLLKYNMIYNPGLYDDLYVDLTFVNVFEEFGFNAPIDSFANSFANAGYPLWHANQTARYNILHGIKAPQSGYWENNPHANCIDYQIESDFAGLMSPGMPNVASKISDKVGHIMSYGDGWYGGVFVGAMYSLAFISSDVQFVVNEALKTIPRKSDFYKCIKDVIDWHKQYPNDWRNTWFEIQKKWTDDISCPEGVFRSYNIDATVNAAYVVLGLLYGGGDFTKSLEITTRCGQDADCNPSTVGGVLGAILGYNGIPEYWKRGLKEVEHIKFKYTDISLNDIYEMGYRHAIENVKRNSGEDMENSVVIKTQRPKSVKLEKSYINLYPVQRIPVNLLEGENTIKFEYEGTGFVIVGNSAKWESKSDFILKTELFVDDKLIEKPVLPLDFRVRRYELAWRYDLPRGKHSVELKILNPSKIDSITNIEVIYYDDKPVDGSKWNINSSQSL